MRESLTVRCSPELKWRIHEFCREFGIWPSELVNVAVARFLNEMERKHKLAPEPQTEEEEEHEPK